MKTLQLHGAASSPATSQEVIQELQVTGICKFLPAVHHDLSEGQLVS